MALNYGDNYVLKIKKGEVEYLVRDSIAEAAINTIQGGAEVVGSIAKAQADAESYAAGLVAGLSNIYDAKGAAGDAENNAKTYADGLASHYDAAGSAAAAETAAKSYAKGLVDKVLGEDSAAETLTTLKQVIAELNDPANQDGITGTFVDTVKAGLAGLGNKTNAVYNFTSYDPTGETEWGTGTAEVIELRSNGATIKVLTNSSDQSFVGRIFKVNTLDETALIPLYTEADAEVGVSVRVSLNAQAVPNTVKDYVDSAIANSGNAKAAIAALDATPSQAAGTDGLALSLTQVDGVVTAISGSIAANTYDAYGAASTAAAGVVGAADDASTANTVYGAKAYADSKISALGASTITNGVLELAL